MSFLRVESTLLTRDFSVSQNLKTALFQSFFLKLVATRFKLIVISHKLWFKNYIESKKHFVKNQNGKTIISAGKKVDRAKLTSPIKQDNQKPTQSNVTINISTIKKDWEYNTRKNLTFYVLRTAWLKCNVESVSKLLLLYFPCLRRLLRGLFLVLGVLIGQF